MESIAKNKQISVVALWCTAGDMEDNNSACVGRDEGQIVSAWKERSL
jgi:hypothetical protein